jgi:hypothetical protein
MNEYNYLVFSKLTTSTCHLHLLEENTEVSVFSMFFWSVFVFFGFVILTEFGFGVGFSKKLGFRFRLPTQL